jgi:Icc-related predicted phosphoesterase
MLSVCVLFVIVNGANKDTEVEVEGIKIYGSPWIARNKLFLQFNWTRWICGEIGWMGLSFALPEGGNELQAKWDAIPADVDVLLTHMPPLGILDLAGGKYHMGCPLLAQTVAERVRPPLHVYGHIHDAHGVHQSRFTTFINAANAFDGFRQAVVVDFDRRRRRVRVIGGTERTTTVPPTTMTQCVFLFFFLSLPFCFSSAVATKCVWRLTTSHRARRWLGLND